MKRIKKRIKIVLILLVLLMLYRRYCVMNVVDEMILSHQSFLFIPYTQTVYNDVDITYEYLGRPMLDSPWPYDSDLKTIFYYESRAGGEIWFYRYKRRMKIEAFLPDSGAARFGVGWKYNVWSKKFSAYLRVYELIDIIHGEKIWWPMEEETAEAYTRKSGMSVEEICERAEAEMKKFLDEWIRANEGKSRFSEGHYGWYREGELEYCWENKNAEWF